MPVVAAPSALCHIVFAAELWTPDLEIQARNLGWWVSQLGHRRGHWVNWKRDGWGRMFTCVSVCVCVCPCACMRVWSRLGGLHVECLSGVG